MQKRTIVLRLPLSHVCLDRCRGMSTLSAFRGVGNRFPSYYDKKPNQSNNFAQTPLQNVPETKINHGGFWDNVQNRDSAPQPTVNTASVNDANQHRIYLDNGQNRASYPPQNQNGSNNGLPMGAPQQAPAGFSAQNPMHVVSHPPATTVRGSLWRVVKWVAGGWLFLSLVSVYLEEMQKLTKGHNMPMEIALTAPPNKKVTFEDVQGIDEVKAELEEIVEFLKDPSKFTRLGGKLPKGVLLTGEPGTGKTLLARAIAGEAGVPFLHCSGSEFDEMFVGIGAKRVRELFAAAKKQHPCIIFIDEIDAIGSKRNPRDQGFAKMTLNQLLVEMDGFAQNEGIIVIGATNFPESLDNALVRPGRFDRHVHVPLPDVKGRTDILRVHLRNIPLQDEVDIRTIARGTRGFSGAELANLVNLAAIKAATEGHSEVTRRNMEYAIDRIIMGTARKMIMSEDERRLTAYHEAGHALVGVKTSGARPVHKATIVPHGRALGMVVSLPKDDEHSVSKKQYLAMMDVAMGGKVAEELIFGPESVTSGASSDLKSATGIASMMVTKFGMSDKVGPVSHDEIKYLSSDRKAMIENEIQKLTEESQKRVQDLLKEHADQHKLLAEALLDYETLTSEEIALVLDGKALSKGERMRSAADEARQTKTQNSKGVPGIKPKLPQVLKD